MPELETRHIGYGIDMATVRAYVFGEILKRGYPHVEIYHSDFYHVATALNVVIPDNTHKRDIRFTVVVEPAGAVLEKFHGGPVERAYLSHKKVKIMRLSVIGDNSVLERCKWELRIIGTEQA